MSICLKDAIFLDFPDELSEDDRLELNRLLEDVHPNAVNYQCNLEWKNIRMEEMTVWKVRNIAEKYTSISCQDVPVEKWNVLLGCLSRVRTERLLEEYPLIPDMNMDRKRMMELCECQNVPDDLLRMMDELHVPWRSEHMHNGITTISLPVKHNRDDARNAICQAVNFDKGLAKKLITFVPNNDVERETMWRLSHAFVPGVGDRIACLEELSSLRLWEDCDKIVCEELVEHVSRLPPGQVAVEMSNIDRFLKFIQSKLPVDRTLSAHPLVPNKLYQMKKKDELMSEGYIPDVFREMMLEVFSVDIRESEIHPSITSVEVSRKTEVSLYNEKLINFLKKHQDLSDDKLASVVGCLIRFIPDDIRRSYNERSHLFRLYQTFFETSMEEIRLDLDEDLWTLMKDRVISRIKSLINSIQNICELCEKYHVPAGKEIELLNICYEFDPSINVPTYDGTMFCPEKAKYYPLRLDDSILDFIERCSPDERKISLADSAVKNQLMQTFELIPYLGELLEGLRDGKEKEIRTMALKYNVLIARNHDLSEEARFFRRWLREMTAWGLERRLSELNKQSDDDKKRWPWELIQNAKDTVAGSDRRVRIEIESFDEKVVFRHYGRGFKLEELLSVIYPCSEGKEDNASCTGKFGSGFMATHVVSGIVDIEGDIIDGGSPSGFQVRLYRQSHRKKDISEGLKKMEESMKSDLDPFGYTSYTYHLDEGKQEIREAGLKHLKSYLPFVLIFSRSIESVILKDVKDGKTTFKFHLIEGSDHDRVTIHVKTKVEGQRKQPPVIQREFVVKSLEEENYVVQSHFDDGRKLQVVCAIEISDNKVKLDKNRDSLFCTFPLVGTSGYRSPVIINSPIFEPTPERHSLFLSTSENDKSGLPTNCAVNREILRASVRLFKEICDYCSEHDFGDLHFLSYGLASGPRVSDDNFDKMWYNDNILSPQRDIISDGKLFRSCRGLEHVGNGHDNVLFFKMDRKGDADAKLWDLVSRLHGDKRCLISIDDCRNWSKFAWDSFPFTEHDHLAKCVATFDCISALPFEGDDVKWSFICDFLKYIVEHDSGWLDNYRVIPTRCCKFMKRAEVSRFVDFSDELFELIDLLHIDFERSPLHDMLAKSSLDISKLVDHKTDLRDLYWKVGCKISEEQSNGRMETAIALMQYTFGAPEGRNDHRETMFEISRTMFPYYPWRRQLVVIPKVTSDLWHRADKRIIEVVVDQIETSGRLNFAAELLNRIFSCIQHLNHPYKWDERRIFPDQNGYFHKKSDLRRLVTGEYPELLHTLMEVADDLRINLRSRTAHPEITQVYFSSWSAEDILEEIMDHWTSSAVKLKVAKAALQYGQIPDIASRAVSFYNQISPTDPIQRHNTHRDSPFSSKSLDILGKFLFCWVGEKITSCGNLEGLSKMTGSLDRSIAFLREFILYLNSSPEAWKLAQTWSIIPNQRGQLCCASHIQSGVKIPPRLLAIYRDFFKEDFSILAHTEIQSYLGTLCQEMDVAEFVKIIDQRLPSIFPTSIEHYTHELRKTVELFQNFCKSLGLSHPELDELLRKLPTKKVAMTSVTERMQASGMFSHISADPSKYLIAATEKSTGVTWRVWVKTNLPLAFTAPPPNERHFVCLVNETQPSQIRLLEVHNPVLSRINFFTT